MPITNYPGGLASFGVPVTPGSVYDVFSGPVYWVCNRAGVAVGDGTSRDKPLASIADALAKLTGDITGGSRIYVAEGHTENVTASNTFSGTATGGPNTGAQVIPAGCRIIGCGLGRARPTLTFTAVASALALANGNCGLENFNLLCPQTGTTTVTAMIQLTGAACQIVDCLFQLSSSATALANLGINLGAVAHEATIVSCQAYGVTGTPFAFLVSATTTAPNRVFIGWCRIRLPLSVTSSGAIDFSAASAAGPVDLEIRECTFANNTAASTVALKLATNATGQVVRCGLGIKAATGAATAISAIGNAELIECYATVPGKAGLIVGTVSG